MAESLEHVQAQADDVGEGATEVGVEDEKDLRNKVIPLYI